MKELFIISTDYFVNARTAGARRVLNIAKSLAAGGVNVFLTSYKQIDRDPVRYQEIFPGIFNLESSNNNNTGGLHLFRFLVTVNGFIKSRNSDTVIYLYPTTFIMRDFMYLLFFKFFKRYKFYCEINELRVTNLWSPAQPARFLSKPHFYLKFIFDYLAYKLNELQVLFYDGIVVISTNLEKYFSRFTKNILRVPILCDSSKISYDKPSLYYDNGVFKICFAGYIHCKKEGFDILLEALNNVNRQKNVELFLYGVLFDEDRTELNRLAEKYQISDKIFYMGNHDPENLSDEFQKYHLLILPRPLTPQTKYGFSTKLSEYLTSGVPVMVTNVSDNTLYIRDSINGFVTEPGSAVLMAEKILDIISNYNSLSPAIVENAHNTVSEELDYRKFTKPFTDFFYQ